MKRVLVPALFLLLGLFALIQSCSFDYATSVIPGWHTTIYPPWFVAGFAAIIFLILLSLVWLVIRLKK